MGMTAPAASVGQVFDRAMAAYRAGRFEDARDHLTPLLETCAEVFEVRRLRALVLQRLGDDRGEEHELRAMLQLSPQSVPTAGTLASRLLASGRAAEGAAILSPFASAPGADAAVLMLLAACLSAAGSHEAAAAVAERACAAAPGHAVAAQNLAGLLCNVERFADAEMAARQAIDAGAEGPAPWILLGRALQGLGRTVEGEAAFEAALQRAPRDDDAHGRRSRSIWTRTGEGAAATADLDAVLAVHPGDWRLVTRKAAVVEAAEGPQAAYDLLASAAARSGADPRLHLAAARIAVTAGGERAVDHLAAAEAAGLEGDDVALLWAEALLGIGDARAATLRAQAVLDRSPADQRALALLGVAGRLTGDDRHAGLFDYDKVVFSGPIEQPPGWSRLEDYLADLADALAPLHHAVAAPIGQSIRNGSQTAVSLRRAEAPAIRGFFAAADRLVTEHLVRLGQGPDALRSRNVGRTQVAGAWSTRLRPGGFHVSHMHPDGWLSSAFYVSLPPAVAGNTREGWLSFGEPDVPTEPGLGPEHFIQPSPGLLVLFPSYLCHSTMPFSGRGERLTVAFDLTPAVTS